MLEKKMPAVTRLLYTDLRAKCDSWDTGIDKRERLDFGAEDGGIGESHPGAYVMANKVEAVDCELRKEKIESFNDSRSVIAIGRPIGIALPR